MGFKLDGPAARLLTLLLFVGCFPATASFAQRPRALAPFSAGASELYAAASRPAPPPGADVQVLNEEESYIFDAKGRCKYTQYLVYKVLTRKGVKGWDGMIAYWQPWRGQKPVFRARVITPDLVVHKLDSTTVTDASAEDKQSNVYSDEHVMRAPLPAVAPGSVIETEIVMRIRPPFPGAGIGASSHFGRISVPVEHQSLTLDAPSSIHLRYVLQLLPRLQPRQIERRGRVKIVFEEGPIAPLKRADPYLPSDVPAYPTVAFSTGDSWHALAKEYKRIIDSRIGATDLQSVVANIVHGQTSNREKLVAISDYLDAEIRYTGVEFGSAAVVPHLPSQTLARQYGDCKDKATLLVALLRAEGIHAYVALLNAGQRLDNSPSLPSIDFFDHAIVYVPGPPSLWIDPTDRYSRVGQIPIWDQGRWALIVRGGTQGLVRIPEAPAEDNVFLESRLFQLAEYGPSEVTETARPEGTWEPELRRFFATARSKSIQSYLSRYAKTQYLAKTLNRLTHSNPGNLSKPFDFVLGIDKATRGDTGLSDATVAIRLGRIFHGLPKVLRERAGSEAMGEGGKNAGKERTADYQIQQAFVTEWDYKIVPPPGFEVEPLPQNVSLSLGPARFTEQFWTNAKGAVQAKIRFDSVKRRFTVAEATKLRNGVAQLIQEQTIDINFEPVGQALINQGKPRQGIQSYRRLIARHPKEAVLHLRLAETLLKLGLGETARAEARAAVKLDPTSELAEKTLAEILEYDIVGRKFRPGSDYAGAEAAFQAALKLDPKDKATVANLAILLEYNRWGLRYGPGANLKGALAEYHKLSQADLQNLGVDVNPAFAEFYSRQFAAALKDAESLNPEPVALVGACEAALHGSPAALTKIRDLSSGESDFKSDAESAGDMLADLRMYPLAADLEAAGASGKTASSTAAWAAIYRRSKPYQQIHFPDDPQGVAERFSLLESDVHLTLTQLTSICSRYGRLTIATPKVRNQLVKWARQDDSGYVQEDDFPEGVLDTSLARAQPSIQGNDGDGYKVVLWPFAKYQESVYVVKEQGQYKVLANSHYPTAIGLEVLDRLAHHEIGGARQLLDWLRDDEHLKGGDDPLAGLPFPRLWTKGQNPDPVVMRLAAAAILAQSKVTAPRAVPILLAALKTVRGESLRTNIRLALVLGYRKLEEYPKELAVAETLARQYPESKKVFSEEVFCLGAAGHSKEADRLAENRLKRLPGNIEAKQVLIWGAIAREDYALAYELGRKMVAEGIARPGDLNETAWQSLFTGKITASDIQYALKAAQLGGGDFAYLHTLACLLAVTGKVRQAHAVLVQAMDSIDLDEPDSECWLALGLIAERCGERTAAIDDYSKVKKPKLASVLPSVLPDSAYTLAQMHLKELRSKP